MATTLPQRRPLETRSLQSLANKSNRAVPGSGSKRARSPTHEDQENHPSPKRVRATAAAEVNNKPDRKEKKEKHEERGARQQEMAAEFKRKYRKAFPEWTFFFNIGLDARKEQALRNVIEKFGGRVDDFFSAKITHLITNHPDPFKAHKENPKRTENKLLSPIKLMNRGTYDTATEDLVAKAQAWNLKIWSAEKLESILHRCSDIPASQSTSASRSTRIHNLSALLDHEKNHGTTERDPTQKRHDYTYFKPGNYFVLLEDMRGELATLAVHEYPGINAKKDRDNSTKKPWPVLHCHPHARNPFIPFDEKEKRRYERQLAAEKEQQQDDVKRREKNRLDVIKRRFAAKQKLAGNDLRRTASVNNIRRRYSHPVAGQHGGAAGVDLDDEADGDELDIANASGCTASNTGAYMAASGNSVGITSATGLTSTSQAFSNNRPTMALDRLGKHVTTHLKFQTRDKENEPMAGAMGPPSKLLTKQHLLKRSKSTNTLRLPKREEGAKPGYCESCRSKFDDFSDHIVSNRHRKFAMNPDNYRGLDDVLSRLQRRTKLDVEEEAVVELDQIQYECELRRNDNSCEVSSP